MQIECTSYCFDVQIPNFNDFNAKSRELYDLIKYILVL